MSKRFIIIGAGPAGLTAALELLRHGEKNNVVVLEADDSVGGLAKTIDWNGNRFDIGGHRFFTTESKVKQWWNDLLPLQTINRHSSIYYRGNYLDYPIRFSIDMIRIIGYREAFKVCCSYICSHAHKISISSLEDFFISRFGKRLYQLFFHDYTKKVWGLEPSQISPDWGPERIAGISLREVITSAFIHRSVEPSLTDLFYYPNQGCGELWDTVAEEIKHLGGQIILNCEVKSIRRLDNRITELLCNDPSGIATISGDTYISTMPIKDLYLRMSETPEEAASVASRLHYRDLVVVGVLLDKNKLENANPYLFSTHDQWIYFQDKTVGFGRIQIYNNWSEKMLDNPSSHLLLALEYFCQEGDRLWELDDHGWENIIQEDLKKTGLLSNEQSILDYYVRRIAKAYPCYWDGYNALDIVHEDLNAIKNLICIGRNGLHQYRNMDDIILEAMRVIDL